MSPTITCQDVGCGRMVSRRGYCRPHFISEVLGWKLRHGALRQIPLGRLDAPQHALLEAKTRGATSVQRILRVIKSAMPA